MRMRRVVIDTDPGTDDALALLMALNCPDFLIEGITTVGGNATLAETTNNALRLVDHVAGVGVMCQLSLAPSGQRVARLRTRTTFMARMGLGCPFARHATSEPHPAGAVEFHSRPCVSTSAGALDRHRARAADKCGRGAGRSPGHRERRSQRSSSWAGQLEVLGQRDIPCGVQHL